MNTRSSRLENLFVAALCALVAAAFFIPIWAVPLKGVVLLIFFLLGSLFFLLTFQLVINALFRSKKGATTNAENTFFDAVIDIILFR